MAFFVVYSLIGRSLTEPQQTKLNNNNTKNSRRFWRLHLGLPLDYSQALNPQRRNHIRANAR